MIGSRYVYGHADFKISKAQMARLFCAVDMGPVSNPGHRIRGFSGVGGSRVQPEVPSGSEAVDRRLGRDGHAQSNSRACSL